MDQKILNQVVAEHPFPDYAQWWDVGQVFTSFMSEAIVSQWSELHHNDGDLGVVKKFVDDYLQVVFGREAKASLVDDFVAQSFSSPIKSGEFDALSYAFYRAAFELIENHIQAYHHPLDRERRLFTKRVGKVFFNLLQDQLALDFPTGLDGEDDFNQLKDSIRQVGAFFKEQRYVRDYFDFRFDLEGERDGERVIQSDSEFLKRLERDGVAYAVYEMGYPIILPSAVYLFNMIGEAQHHSSRTIEELFDLVGYEARETDDFDPSVYPSDSVVEFWEIREKPG
jgi:hypothetical protein